MNAILQRRGLIALCAIGLMVGGVVRARGLPSGIYPEVEFPRIVVVARAGDAPPEVTQVELTRPLETELATVLGVERIRSRTIRGAVELSLLFTPGTDMWRALQLVESRVGDARGSLPPKTDVVVERLTTTSFPVVTFNVTGAIDARRLREAAELTLKPALSRVRGVGRVEVLGGEVREVEIVLDPAQAASLRVTPVSVADKVRTQSVLQAVGRAEDARSWVTVMASSEPHALEDLEAIPIAVGSGGAPVPLSTVATVSEGAEDKLLRVSGPGGETVLVSVSRLPGASTPEVVDAVKVAVASIASALPAGVTVTPVYDQAALVDESMRSVRDAILLGIALCIGVIALFLRDLRAGLVGALTLPVTLGATFLPIAAMGQSLNLMSLGGLAVAIGLVIDDAIVVVEAIRRRMEEGETVQNAAIDGVRQMMGPLIGTTLTTVVVFVPLAWLEGLVGRFFIALASTLAAAVVISLAVAVLVVPIASASLLRAPRTETREPAYRRLYLVWSRRLLAHRWLGPVIAVALLLAGGIASRFLGTGFLPTMDEGAFVLDYFLPADTSLEQTDAAAKKIESVLATLPEVQTWSRRTGAELGPAAATLVSRGDIMVRLKPASQRSKSADQVIEVARAAIEEQVPEARVEFVQVLQDVLNDLAGTPRPIELKLFGPDYAVLHEQADEIAKRLEPVKGLVDAYPGYEVESPQLTLRIDPALAARLGKTAEDVSHELDSALHGEQATVFRKPDRPIGVRVRYPDSVRFDLHAVEHLPLLAGTTAVTTFGSVARFEQSTAATALEREQLRPVVIYTADHENRDLGSLSDEVKQKLASLKLPEGYSLELGGQIEAQRATFTQLAQVVAFGALAVLIVLLAQFRRPRLAVLVLLTVPLSVVGALVTLAVLQVPLNASSLMGCVLLVGLVVKNGILLLGQAEALVDGGHSWHDALLDAGAARVRPILMTTLATIAGMAPLALGIGSGAELQRPLALAVIGGLLASTVVSLLVLPSLVLVVKFSRFEKAGESPRARPLGG